MWSTVLQAHFSASSRIFPADWSRSGPDTGLWRRGTREPSGARCGICDDAWTPTTHHTAAPTAMTSVPHRHIHVIRHVMQSTPRVAETVKVVRRCQM